MKETLIMAKICSLCGEMRDINLFSVDQSKSSGKKNYCKVCQNLGNRIRRNGTIEYKRPVYPSNGFSKKCSKCLQEKSLREFGLHKYCKGGLDYWCKDCCSKNKKEWRMDNLKKANLTNRKGALKRKFNITLEQYDILLMKQNGCCLICGATSGDAKGASFMVDHDHNTEIIRGLLCRKCNSALGLFKDNSMLLRRAADYLDNNGYMRIANNHTGESIGMGVQ